MHVCMYVCMYTHILRRLRSRRPLRPCAASGLGRAGQKPSVGPNLCVCIYIYKHMCTYGAFILDNYIDTITHYYCV